VLPPALEDVASFVRDNRDGLHTDVGKLASITDILVRQQKALTEITDVAPLALGNLTNTYNASSGTLDTRTVLPSVPAGFDPRSLLCGLLTGNPLGGALGDPPPARLPPQLSQALVTCAALSPGGAQALRGALAPYQQLGALLAHNHSVAAPITNLLAATSTPPATTDPTAPTAPGQGLLHGLLPNAQASTPPR
jgi:hypothetical protein